MLLGRAGLGAEGLELPPGLRPAPEAVEREAVQLAHRRGPGRLLGQGPQDAAAVLVALAAEGVAGLVQALLEPGHAVGGHHPVQLLLGRGPLGPAAPGPGPASIRSRGRLPGGPAAVDRTCGFVPQLAFVDPLLRLPRGIFVALAAAFGPLALTVTTRPCGSPGIRGRGGPSGPPPRQPAPRPRAAHLTVVVPVVLARPLPVPVGAIRRPGRTSRLAATGAPGAAGTCVAAPGARTAGSARRAAGTATRAVGVAGAARAAP